MTVDPGPSDGSEVPRQIFEVVTRSFKRVWRAFGFCVPGFRANSVLPELVAIGCFLVLPWVGIGVALRHEYHSIENAAERSTGNLARALEESTRRTIGQIDSILLSARALQAAQGERFDFHEWVRTQTFTDRMAAQIAMVDSTGLVTASTTPLRTPVNVADRLHFRAQIDPAHDELFISEPMVGRVSGLQTI